MDIGHIDDYLHLYLLVSFTVLFTWYFWRIIWNKQLIWAKLQSKLQLHLDPRQLKHPISTLYIKPLFPHSNSKLEFFSDKIEFLRYNDQISVTPWQFWSFVCQVATQFAIGEWAHQSRLGCIIRARFILIDVAFGHSSSAATQPRHHSRFPIKATSVHGCTTTSKFECCCLLGVVFFVIFDYRVIKLWNVTFENWAAVKFQEM